jgi:hypothetical protein
MNRKGLGKMKSLPNFKILSRHLPGGTEKKHEKFKSG